MNIADITNREYDFYNFNTVDASGNITITVLVSPSFNANGDDQPLAFAVQIDSQDPQSLFPMPPAVPGGVPVGWDGPDGFVANSIVSVNATAPATPGAHTLKVREVARSCLCAIFLNLNEDLDG